MRKQATFQKNIFTLLNIEGGVLQKTQHIPPFLISWHKNYSVAYMSTATNIHSLTLEKDYLTLLTSTKDK